MKTEEMVYVTSRSTRSGWQETRCVWKAGGLAVTQWLGTSTALDWSGEETSPSTEHKYVVTHLPTGDSVHREPLAEAEAIRLAETLLPLADWPALTLTDMVRGIKERPEWVVAVGAAVSAFLKQAESQKARSA